MIIIAIALLLLIAGTAGAVNDGIDKKNNTLNLEQGYKLHLVSVDAKASPRMATFQLTHEGVKQIVIQGDNFSFYDGDTLILKAKLDAVFAGATADMIQILNLVQYDKKTGEIILEIDGKITLVDPDHPPYKNPHKYSADTLDLKQGYELQLMSVDDKADPTQIWLQFRKGNKIIDDMVVGRGDNFSFYNGNELVLQVKFDPIFPVLGPHNFLVQLKDFNQYSRGNGNLILYLERVTLMI